MVTSHCYSLRKPHSTASDISEILPKRLYLGNKSAAGNLKLLTELGITHILNTTHEIKCHFPNSFKYLRIAISDGDPDIIDHFEDAISYINSGKVVFVHCAQGVSRSASFTIAYLMSTYNWSFKKSLEFVRAKRPIVRPHFNFQLALMNDADQSE